MKKLFCCVFSFVFLISYSTVAQKQVYDVFKSESINVGYNNGFITTNLEQGSKGRIKLLVLGTKKHNLNRYKLSEYNDNIVNQSGTWCYKCLKVISEKAYDSNVLLAPIEYDKSLNESYISFYYYDQLMDINFAQNFPRINGSHQINELEFIILFFLDDKFQVAKRISASAKGQLIKVIDISDEIKNGIIKSCEVVSSSIDPR